MGGGGAGDLSPWQENEWVHLLNATRYPSTIWEYEVAARVALSVEIDGQDASELSHQTSTSAAS